MQEINNLQQTPPLQQTAVSGSKYWYATDVYCCVLCGKETKYKGRVYDESKKGTKWNDDMCWEHKF